MGDQFTIVGLGEALFDIFPDRQVLGGAPLNAAVHAHQLAAVRGGRGVIVSRLGQDELGKRAQNELTGRSISTEYIQMDPDHSTGKVHVTVDEDGQPDYEIVEHVAWDWLQWDPDLEHLARHCDAVCFSGLAQRQNQTRSSIHRFVTEAAQAVRLFDLTLRQHFYDQRMLRHSCELANVVKLNLEELDVLSAQINLPGKSIDAQIRTLIDTFALNQAVLTRGAEGTVIYTRSRRYEGEPVHYEPAKHADSVGAGDACTAAILVGAVLRLPVPKILQLANHAGAYVASVPGATPTLPATILQQLN